MLNHFLAEEGGLTTHQHKIIQKMYLKRRRYNPFHLDCPHSKKKLCYCKKNPVVKMSEGQRAELWKNSYMEADEFYEMKKEEAVNR